MMLWDERFKSSQAWQHVAHAREQMNGPGSTMPESRSEQDALEYAGMVLELLEQRRDNSDAREITPTMLNQLSAAVTNFASSIESVNNGNAPWSEVTGSADAVLDALAAWPPMKIARYLSGLNSAAEAFQNKTVQAIEHVGSVEQKVAEELETLREKGAELQVSVDTERQRISEAIAEFKVDSTETLNAANDAQEEQRADLLARWEAANTAAESSAKSTLERLDALEEQARNVVHATTSHVVATDYGQYARNKTVAAWVCDIAAAFVGAAGLAVIIHHLLSIDPGADSNLGLSVTRLAVSIGSLGIAALLGRRGQQHHREARAAKRTDLALRQVQPFTANLPEEERTKVVLQLTERVFIRGDLDTRDAASSLLSQVAAARKSRSGAGNDAAGE